MTDRLFYLILILFVIAADQLSKYWAMSIMGALPNQMEVFPFLNLVVVWNKGVSFGLFNAPSEYGPYILIAMSSAISVWFLIWLFQIRDRLQSIALSLVIGGAIGNIIDRVQFGAVYDFLDFHVAGFHWPAFNIADSTIVIGVGLLLFHALFLDKSKSNKPTEQE
jgi:signal peptidase II